MSSWHEIFEHYANHPFEAWPAKSPRQATKLSKRLTARAAALGCTVPQLVREIIEVAAVRAKRPPLTVFIPNCGSSGSHWLEPMIQDLGGYAAGGEIYLPPAVRSRLRALSPTARTRFIDAVHLAHVEGAPGTLVDTRLINTAHSWEYPDLFHAEARTILLARHPVDIVVSRSYRKSEYRATVAPTMDDRAYLKRNVDVVNTFYAGAAPYDHVVKYEDLRSRGDQALAEVMAALDDPRDAVHLASTHRAFTPGGDKTHQTNLYDGPTVVVPEWVRPAAAAQLSDAPRKFGYEY